MKTTIQVTIEHEGKLPDGVTDATADRVYGYINGKGGHAMEVVATIVQTVDLVALPVVKMGEPS